MLTAAVLMAASCGTANRGPLTADELSRVTINPIPLNYRFLNTKPVRREAADPVCERFGGRYYLFASKSRGYWSSEDMRNWKYIPAPSIESIQNYAPTVMVRDSALWFIASGSTQIYRTTQPETGVWEKVPTKFNYGMTDPCLFGDDDGRVYMYWGCSDKDPIVGVEVDPNDGFAPIGKPDSLIFHNIAEHGWEVAGHDNDRGVKGWNEGPSMNKLGGRYYLQYAAPGTQYHVYGDGVYVGDSPLGPFTYQKDSPFSFKPGGFIYGAGHGHTFTDRYGNLWHTATMAVSVRHGFERRLGMFPAYVTKDGTLATHTVLTDWPFVMPDRKTDFSRNDLSAGWILLSYGKAVRASSVLRGAAADKAKVGLENPWKTETFEPSNAVNEQVGNWWAAATGKAGEWIEIDLGREMDVSAIHVNFSDHGLEVDELSSFVYSYTVEASSDRHAWTTVIDKPDNAEDRPHDLNVLPSAVRTRYIRLTNRRDMPAGALFSVSGLRIFGKASGKAPARVKDISAERDAKDTRHITLRWTPVDAATGYIVRWGTSPKNLSNACMVYGDTRMDARFFNRDDEYFFTVDAFNESGMRRGEDAVVAETMASDKKG